MPRSDKSKYTVKQKRQAEHIEAGYRRRGMSEEEAERRAWATVNKIHGGGNKPGGSGYGKRRSNIAAKKASGKNRTAAMISGQTQRATSATSAAPTPLKKRSLKAAKNWRPSRAREHSIAPIGRR